MRQTILLILIFFLLGVGTAESTVFAPTNLEKLSRQSQLIARVRVSALASSWNEQKNRIYTTIEFAVIEIIKGQAGDKIVIQQLGGVVGEDALLIQGAPDFQVSEEAVVFLSFHQGHYRVASLGLGKFDVLEQNGKVIVLNRIADNKTLFIEGLDSEDPLHPKFELTTFIQRIKQY